MLSASEVASFVADGYVAIRGAVPAGTVRACQDVIWSELAGQGIAVLRFRPALWSFALECYLAELYVAPASRGRGLGRAQSGCLSA